MKYLNPERVTIIFEVIYYKDKTRKLLKGFEML